MDFAGDLGGEGARLLRTARRAPTSYGAPGALFVLCLFAAGCASGAGAGAKGPEEARSNLVSVTAEQDFGIVLGESACSF